MKIRGFAIGMLLGFMASATLVWAANVTFNITSAGQDTAIRAEMLPIANMDLCAQFGLPADCTAQNLTDKGCVAKAFTTVTKRDLTYQNCTPFTLDATGQANDAGDIYAKAMIARFERSKTAQIVSACTNFKALSASNQNSICAALGSPVPATVCDICK